PPTPGRTGPAGPPRRPGPPAPSPRTAPADPDPGPTTTPTRLDLTAPAATDPKTTMETREPGTSHREHQRAHRPKRHTLHRQMTITIHQATITCGFGSERSYPSSWGRLRQTLL